MVRVFTIAVDQLLMHKPDGPTEAVVGFYGGFYGRDDRRAKACCDYQA